MSHLRIKSVYHSSFSVTCTLHHVLYVFYQVVAFKVHGVRDKEARVEEKKVPPVENRKLSGGIIALVAVASMVAIFISIFVVFQLVSFNTHFYFYSVTFVSRLT